MEHSPILKAVRILGSQVALSLAIGVQRQAINSWVKGNVEIPIKHCPSIEKVTKGAVTCESLRPDFDWAALRV